MRSVSLLQRALQYQLLHDMEAAGGQAGQLSGHSRLGGSLILELLRETKDVGGKVALGHCVVIFGIKYASNNDHDAVEDGTAALRSREQVPVGGWTEVRTTAPLTKGTAIGLALGQDCHGSSSG